MKLTITLTAVEEANMRAWAAYLRANQQYVGVTAPPAGYGWHPEDPQFQSRIVLEEQTRARFEEISGQLGAIGGDVDGGTYTPNDAHAMPVKLSPGRTTSVQFNGPGKVSAAIPEGANGGVGALMNITTAPGEQRVTINGADLISPKGRGLLANVTAPGKLYAVLWLPEGATEPTEATFNIGTL